MRSASILAIAAGGISAVNAVSQGFNYGSTQTDGSVKDQATFESEFKTAKNLVGTSGFTSARLYTMIQGGTTSTPISAIPAAIAQSTTLLLGLWASGGQTDFDNEITALKSAIATYGTSFTSLVTAISVGSEDLYRDSYTGQQADAGVGVGPDVVVSYIKAVRTAIAGTALSSALVGHVDTWNAWTNSSNSAVISNCDWLGMDTYPYFQNTQANSIDNAKTLFYDAYDATVAVAGGKDVWITETGWPVSGSTENQGVPSLANAKTYWDQVGCPSFGKVNTYWYTLQDSYPTTPNPSFGIVGTTLSTTPLYDLSCSNVTSSSSTTSSKTSSAASTGSAASSAKSSAASAGSSVLATGSSGLTPSQGNGNGVISSAVSVAAASTGSVRSGNGTSAAVTTATATSTARATGTTATTVKTSGSSSGSGSTATTTSAQTTYTGAAVAVSGSMFGAVGAIFALVAAI